jgi:hypothetical protein
MPLLRSKIQQLGRFCDWSNDDGDDCVCKTLDVMTVAPDDPAAHVITTVVP